MQSELAAHMCTWLTRARAVTPANMETAMRPSRASVVAAFLLLGLRNAGTPLLIASTPVSAVQPEENARSSRKISATPPNWRAALIWYPALSERSGWPSASRVLPQMIISATMPMKK